MWVICDYLAPGSWHNETVRHLYRGELSCKVNKKRITLRMGWTERFFFPAPCKVRTVLSGGYGWTGKNYGFLYVLQSNRILEGRWAPPKLELNGVEIYGRKGARCKFKFIWWTTRTRFGWGSFLGKVGKNDMKKKANPAMRLGGEWIFIVDEPRWGRKLQSMVCCLPFSVISEHFWRTRVFPRGIMGVSP